MGKHAIQRWQNLRSDQAIRQMRFTIHGVRIFGKRPPSPNIDQVPQDDIGRSLHFKNGASELWEHYKTHPTFSDLSVKWGDLIKHRKVLLGRGSN
jgi:hypothetical protein